MEKNEAAKGSVRLRILYAALLALHLAVLALIVRIGQSHGFIRIFGNDTPVSSLAELDALKARQKGAELLFEQTARALVNAIEAKDVYSRGHSLRVAEYSRKIARAM